MKQTDEQVKELVDAAIKWGEVNKGISSAYPVQYELQKAIKPFLSVKPRVDITFTSDTSNYQHIEITDEVEARLSPTAGVEVEDIMGAMPDCISPDEAREFAETLMKVIADGSINCQ